MNRARALYRQNFDWSCEIEYGRPDTILNEVFSKENLIVFRICELMRAHASSCELMQAHASSCKLMQAVKNIHYSFVASGAP